MNYMRAPKYLWSDTVLSTFHLINRMPSSVLDGKISSYCLYPNKSAFSMTLCVFDRTY